MSAICGDRIGVSYMVLGDLARPISLGENTSGLRGEFEWTYLQCNVKTHAGVMTRLNPLVETQKVIALQANDSKKLQQATGWRQIDTQNFGPDDVATFESLVNAAAAGNNKYTRLVKGMLIYLDVLRDGVQTLGGDINNIVNYVPAQVLPSFRAQGRSYAFCSKTTSTAYGVLLYLMGLEYPPRWGGYVGRGNVHVPADAEAHYLVAKGVMTAGRFTCDLSAQLVWIGVVNYAREMGLGDEIEPALVTACSLYENRYLREVSLPRVESTIDLVRPAFSPITIDDSLKPVIDSNMSIILGRCHQMSALLLSKDMIIAAQSSSSPGYNFSRIFRGYVSGLEADVTRMSQAITPVPLLAATARMRWLSCLNDEDISDIGSLSILEGLWMVSSDCKSVDRGGIDLMVRGKNDMIKANGYTELLSNECRKIGIPFRRDRLPSGRYSVVPRCLYSLERWTPPHVDFEDIEIELNFPCDYRGHERVECTRPRRSRMSSGQESVDNDSVVQAFRQARGNNRSATPQKVVSSVSAPTKEVGLFGGEYSGGSDVMKKIKKNSRRKRVSYQQWADDQTDASGAEEMHEPQKKEEIVGAPARRTSTPIVGEAILPRGKWSVKPKVKPDLEVEDELYGDTENHKLAIIRSGPPKLSSRTKIWEDLRMTHLMDGHLIVPITQLENAIMYKDKFEGNVDISWGPEIMSSIINSKGWSDTLKNRRIKLGEKVFGDNKPYYYGMMVTEGAKWDDIKWMEDYFSDTTINLPPEVANRELVGYEGQVRDYKSSDSMSSTKRTINDSRIASALVDRPVISMYISSSQIKSLKNVFRFKPFELAKMRRNTVEE
jgi:hypothetical protein